MVNPGLTAPGEVRVAPLMELPSLLRSMGVAPEVAFDRAGVSLSLFELPENRIEHEAIGCLLSECSSLTGRSDFGLLLTSRFSLREFGILGELMRHSATVGQALSVLMLHLDYHDRLAYPLLLRTDSTNVFLGYSLRRPESVGTVQIYDAAITVAFRILRELCGPDWQPRLVQFSHQAPLNAVTYRRIFGPPVRFNAEWSGISFGANWLEHAVAGSNPSRYEQLHQQLRELIASDPISFADEVRSVLHRLMLSGSPSANAVARSFGVSERTLRHKLCAEGSGVRELLTETRSELARHLLLWTELPVSKIAASLCYSDTAVFSRAFSRWTGISPSHWRDRQPEHSRKVPISDLPRTPESN